MPTWRQLKSVIAVGLVATRIELSEGQPFRKRLNHLRRVQRALGSKSDAADFLLAGHQGNRRGRSARTIDREIGLRAKSNRGEASAPKFTADNWREERLVQLAAEFLRANARSISPFVAFDQAEKGATSPSKEPTATRSVSTPRGSAAKTIHRLGFFAGGHPPIMHSCSLESGAATMAPECPTT